MELKFVYSLIFIAALYSVYRILTRPSKEFQQEIDKIINSDECKIKGQFD